MLREGFRNEVMDGYLAGICARTENLHLALDRSDLDQTLLDGAAGIIRALIEGGPADSIDDYEHAPATIRRYVRHVLKVNDLNLEHFLCVAEILQFLSNDEGWESRLSKGWTDELRDQIRDQCREIVNRDVWRNKIAVGLKSEDPMIFDEADIAAAKLKIDTRDLHLARVRSAPITSGSWYRLLQQTDETQIDEVIDFALQCSSIGKNRYWSGRPLGFRTRIRSPRCSRLVIAGPKTLPRPRVGTYQDRFAEPRGEEPEHGSASVSCLVTRPMARGSTRIASTNGADGAE